MTSSMVQTTEVNQIYRGIIDQVDVWIQLGLLKTPKPGSDNAPMKEYEFTPNNYAIINQLKDYINDIKMQLLSTRMIKDQKSERIKTSSKFENEGLGLQLLSTRMIKDQKSDRIKTSSKFENEGLNAKIVQVEQNFINLRSTCKENILNNKDELWLMKSSADYCKRLLYYTTESRNINKDKAEELAAARQIVAVNRQEQISTCKENILSNKDELWLMKSSADYCKRLLYYTTESRNINKDKAEELAAARQIVAVNRQEQISTCKENILNNKDELWLMKSSADYCKRLLYYTTESRNINKDKAEELAAARQIVAVNRQEQISTCKENILNNKDELWLMKSSADYCKRLLYYTTESRNINKDKAEELAAARQIVAVNRQEQISTCKENILNNKDELWLMKSSSDYYKRLPYGTTESTSINKEYAEELEATRQLLAVNQDQIENLEENIMSRKKDWLFSREARGRLFYKKQLDLNNPMNVDFFTITMGEGIYLWRYDNSFGSFNPTHMINVAESGEHKRGAMNREGIYIVAGYRSNDVKIYDMKYYNHEDQKIKLLRTFSHTDFVYECIFKNAVSALCCDRGGYIKEYDLTNPNSIPDPTVFNRVTLNGLHSLILARNGKGDIFVIGGSYDKLYIINAESGDLNNIQTYIVGGSPHAVYQIAEIRQGIIITVEYTSAFMHDIRGSTKTSEKLTHDIGFYYTVIALKSRPGDLAIGGVSTSYLGVVYIQNIDASNTIRTLDYVDDIPSQDCVITAIKEVKLGTILIGGESPCMLCLWNYSTLPSQRPSCWKDDYHNVYDILQIPY